MTSQEHFVQYKVVSDSQLYTKLLNHFMVSLSLMYKNFVRKENFFAMKTCSWLKCIKATLTTFISGKDARHICITNTVCVFAYSLYKNLLIMKNNANVIPSVSINELI